MRISLVTPGIPPCVVGGIQRYSFNLCRFLSKLGVQVDLYHTDFRDAKGIDALVGMTPEEQQNITSIGLPWPQGDRMPGHYLRECGIFSESVLQHIRSRPMLDFIYVQGFTGKALLEARARGELAVPVGLNFHGLEMFQTPPSLQAVIHNFLFRRVVRKELKQADLVFSFGGKIREIIKNQGVPSQKIIESDNGIETSWIRTDLHAMPKPVRRFVFVGRYERRKGVQELHAAIQRLHDASLPFAFEFVGPVPASERLNLPEVSYLGEVKDQARLQEILDRNDCLVCPSHAEGMPTVILEAMARGLAILATDVGAVSGMVSSSNGILLPNVSIASVSLALEGLIKTADSEMARMKEASLAKIREFTWEEIAVKTLDAIREKLAA